MEHFLLFLIILIIILGIYYIYIDKFKKENFNTNDCVSKDLLTLNPYTRCEILGKKKFMIRDLRTKLWLISGQEEGFNKFLPGRFGISLLMSEKPDDYLPLRTVANPNDYLLSTYTGNGIRTVSNPNDIYFIIQVFIFNGYNILGYVYENNKQKYLYIDNNGNISNKNEPSEASIVEIIEI